jgi:hypothetical protein
MRLTLEGVASRPGVNGNGIRSVSNGVDIVCLMASTSMSGRARTRRVRNQKRAPPQSGANGNGLRSINNGGDTACPMAFTSMSGRPRTRQLRRLQNQKRAPPRPGVNGNGLRSNSNGGVTVCPMACTSISGELQSLKKSKEKARRTKNNDRFGGRLGSSVKLGLVSSERASATRPHKCQREPNTYPPGSINSSGVQLPSVGGEGDACGSDN